MTQVSKSAFLAGVAEIAAMKPSYQLGHDGSDGKCDCIGLVIGGIRRAGGKWTGTHGSNYAARNEVEYLLPIEDVGELNVGEVVFKAAMPGGSNYNLPSKYASDPDKRDYYHVGVVTSTAPLEITHCTGPGIVRDTKQGKWNYRGWLRKVSQEGGTMPYTTTNTTTTTATVTAASGSNVNLRASASTSAALVERVPVGATVTVSEYGDSWCRVSYDGKTGWMMRRYLTLPSDTANETDTAADTVSIQLPRALAEQLLQALYEGTGRG